MPLDIFSKEYVCSFSTIIKHPYQDQIQRLATFESQHLKTDNIKNNKNVRLLTNILIFNINISVLETQTWLGGFIKEPMQKRTHTHRSNIHRGCDQYHP